MMNVNNRTSASQPAFKGKFGNLLDFCDSNTPRNAIMLLYSGCIASRLVNSRDKYEFRETLTRDSIGWTSLFFAATLAEKTFAYLAEKLSGNKNSGEYTGLFIGKNTAEKPKSLWDVIKPDWKCIGGDKFKMRSFEDINALETKLSVDKASQDVFKAIKNHKCVSYLASLGVAIGILGIFIPWLNVVTTRHQLKEEEANKKKAKQLQNSQTNVNQENITIESFFKLTSQDSEASQSKKP